MKLIVNISNNLIGGGFQVARSFLFECRNHPVHEYHVFINKDMAGQVDRTAFAGNFLFHEIPPLPIWKLGCHLRRLEREINPDCVFTVFGPSYWRPAAAHVEGFARVYYIYPESPFFKTRTYRERLKLWFHKTVKMFFFKREADAYVVETADVATRFRKLSGRKNIYTVSNTCGSHFFSPRKFPDKLPPREKNEFRLLTVSAYYPHKNIQIIPAVLDKLHALGMTDIRFVLTLREKDYERLIPEKYRNAVYNTGPVPTEKCPSLYNECDAMFLPTMLECFSASYPEAMATRKPVLTSDLDFARSICGESALYFNTFDADDIARKIVTLASDPALRHILAEKGYERLRVFDNAEQRARKYLEICQNIANGNGR